MSESIFLGSGGAEQNEAQSLLLSRANRHGLVAGATRSWRKGFRTQVFLFFVQM